jgi:hypothetical protein
MYVMYYAPMLRCWQLVRILVKTNHLCLRVGHHILVGVDLDIFDIGAIDEGDYYVKFHMCNKDTYFKWTFVAVYGPAQNAQKEQFLTEIVHMMSHERLPILMGEILTYSDMHMRKIRRILRVGGLSCLLV